MTQKELQIHHKGIKISWGVVGVGVIWEKEEHGGTQAVTYD